MFFKKKINFLLVTVLTLTLPFTVVSASSLSPEEIVKNRIIDQQTSVQTQKIVNNDAAVIEAELIRIGQQYGVGEALSAEDAEFIKEHAPIQFNQDQRKVIASSDKTKFFEGYNNSNGIDAGLVGCFTPNNGEINHTFRTYMTTYDRAQTARPKITNTMTFTGYGVMGSDGIIGKVVDFTETNTCVNTSECTLDRTKAYSGIVLYAHAAPIGQIFKSSNTDAGSVTISKVTEWNN